MSAKRNNGPNALTTHIRNKQLVKAQQRYINALENAVIVHSVQMFYCFLDAVEHQNEVHRIIKRYSTQIDTRGARAARAHIRA